MTDLAPALEALRGAVARAGLDSDWPRVERALRAAHEAHRGQTRRDGSPYFVHPLRVARLVLETWGVADADLACAALLHDAVEDTPLTLEDVERLAGARVRELVDLLTKRDPAAYGSKAERDREYFARLAAGDPGAAIVKCADRVDNLRDVERSGWTLAKKREYLVEARERILPLATGRAPLAAQALEAVIAEVEGQVR